MTRLEKARRGEADDAVRAAAQAESIDPEALRQGVADGTVVVLRNRKRPSCRPVAVGAGTRTKVNANLGTSKDRVSLEEEIEKLEVSVEAGADTVMDLSTGGDIDAIRKEILRACAVPLGTVPIYQAVIETVSAGRPMVEMKPGELLEVIRRHGEDGVDFVTVHCGITRRSLDSMKSSNRIMGIVSRGGSFTAAWMEYNEAENPLYEYYDDLLEIAREYEMTLSLGDGFRPGSILDATDKPQIEELITLGELAARARERGVQVMIEGPGHVPLNQIEANVLLEKRYCGGAPFYVLGPLVTDIAPGYDHIGCAIGGAVAAAAGADFLCYVTPSEHLGLPTVPEVREGVIAARIAAHAADIAKGIPGALEKDRQMSLCRRRLDWEGQIEAALDPQKARDLRESRHPEDEEVCTMCGEYRAVRISNKVIGS